MNATTNKVGRPRTPDGLTEAVETTLRRVRTKEGVGIADLTERALGKSDLTSRMWVTAILHRLVKRGEAVKVGRGRFAPASQVDSGASATAGTPERALATPKTRRKAAGGARTAVPSGSAGR